MKTDPNDPLFPEEIQPRTPAEAETKAIIEKLERMGLLKSELGPDGMRHYWRVDDDEIVRRPWRN